MSLEAIVGLVITAALGLLGFLGWSHKSLNKRIDRMEIEVYKKTSFSDARQMFADKMAPIQSEYNSLVRRMDELKTEHHKINDKIDELLVICTKLSNGK